MLKARREMSFDKFTRNTFKKTQSTHWLPEIPAVRVGNYIKKKLQINSPMFAMPRLLNDSRSIEQVDGVGPL